MNAILRDFEYWTPEPLWHGEQAFVLASGPSLTLDVLDQVRGRHTIAVNSTALLAPWAEVLYFTDSSWYETHRDLVRDWPGLVVSMSRTAKRELPDKVKRVQGIGDPAFAPSRFPRRGSPEIRQGRSSGQTAISLAIALGARQIVMLGFDMRAVDGREHHHQDYVGPRDMSVYANEFLPAFAGWNAAALVSGVEIINATPGSAVREFKMVDLAGVLR